MEANRMTLQVITPDQTILQADGLTRIRIKLADGGTIGIRPQHHPLLAETEAGDVEFGVENYDQSIALQAGILEINYSQVSIYTSGRIGSTVEVEPEGGKLEFERLTRTLLKQQLS